MLMEREGVISLGDAVMAPEERDVVFAKERSDGEVAAEASLGIVMEGRRLCLPELAAELTRKIKAKANGILRGIAIA